MNQVSFIVYAGSIVRICALMIVGIPFVVWCSTALSVLCKKRFSLHVGVLIGRIIFYGGLLFIGVTILHEFGFNVTALLGAAGVIGVAIGFASQTSISNIISGFFLLIERPFSIGDTIKNGDIVGVVESIDLLAIRVRTLDNKMVRLPNEMVLKNALTNFTYYPIRRVDCMVSMPYSTDMVLATNVLYNAIKNNQLFLIDPAPVVILNKIAQPDLSNETRLFFIVRGWVTHDKFSSAPSVLMQQLKSEFDKDNSIITVTQVN